MEWIKKQIEETYNMTEMNGLQKLIVTTFILTIILTCISLGMFFIDVPYKSTEKCTENKTATNDFSITGHFSANGIVKDCVLTSPKEISPVHDAIINMSGICGGIFVILSAYAYYERKKNKIS